MENFLLTIVYGLVGISGGCIVAGGLFSFIIGIGVVTRIIARTRTSKYVKLLEDVVTVGATIGNLYYIFEWRIPLGIVGLLLYGLCGGVFVGCLAVSLAEVLKVIPVFSKRVKLSLGLSIIIVSFALGKGIGTLIYLLN